MRGPRGVFDERSAGKQIVQPLALFRKPERIEEIGCSLARRNSAMLLSVSMDRCI